MSVYVWLSVYVRVLVLLCDVPGMVCPVVVPCLCMCVYLLAHHLDVMRWQLLRVLGGPVAVAHQRRGQLLVQQVLVPAIPV